VFQTAPDGFQNLTMLNVGFAEAGCYSCVDWGGFGANTGVVLLSQLTVTGEIT